MARVEEAADMQGVHPTGVGELMKRRQKRNTLERACPRLLSAHRRCGGEFGVDNV
jgi:hypothetical protein